MTELSLPSVMLRLRHFLLGCLGALSLVLPAARGAVDITNVYVTNVGTTSFTVVWNTSEVSTPGIEVFSDSAGTNAITATLGLEYYPIAEGDPVVVNNSGARAGRRALELLAINRGVVAVRVTGLVPGTPYYVRPRTFGPGAVDNGTSVMPLTPVTTAQFTSMVNDARLVRVRFPAFAAEGMIAVFHGPAGTMPLSAIVGDSTSADSALFPLAGLLDASSGTNALFAAQQQIAVRVFGVGAPSGTSTHTINFGTTFNVARYELIDASLTSPAPLIGTQPENRTAVVGASTTFTVAASGTPTPGYRWQRKPAGSSTWADLVTGTNYSGVNTATLTVSNLALDMTGDQFRCIASNGVPPDATSNAATLTVTAAPAAPLFTTHPQSATVVAGLSATFTVAASGTQPIAFKWQRKPASSANWVDLANDLSYAGVTTATLTVNSTTVLMSGDQFRAMALNGISPDATSNVATLTVSPAPAAPLITTHPQPTTVAAGATATFTVAASGTPPPNFRWQHKPAASTTWSDVLAGPGYSGTTTATLSVNSVTVAMTGDEYRAIASNGVNPEATSNAATLTVTAVAKTPATIALSNLFQNYNGLPRVVGVTTTPAGLTTVVTYNGSATAPTSPGTYAIVAQIDDATYAGSASGTLIISSTVLVRRAPVIAGGVLGSVQVMLPESITLDGAISNDLLVPGTPNLLANPAATLGGTRDGSGDAAPTTHQVTLNASAALRYLVRRTNALPMPTVTAPPAPTGTRSVTLTAAGQSAGDFATLRNLTLVGSAGSVAVPPGTYGNLSVTGSSTLVLGVAGATEAAVYNLQGLLVNPQLGTAKLSIVGPVIVTVATGPTISGDAGSPNRPDWLTIRVASGNLAMNSTAKLYGSVIVPGGAVTLNGSSLIKGSVTSDRLTVTVNADVEQAP